MMQVTVTHDLDELRRKLVDLRVQQIPYATARALTATAKAAQAAMPAYLERVLERPKPFTKSGMFVTAANKQTLTAVVGFKDIQARYLSALITGSERRLKPSEQRFMGRYFVPARGVTVDRFGNVGKTMLLGLLKAAQQKGAWKGRRVVVVPESSASFAPGVYLGNAMSNRRALGLTPVLFFVSKAPRYRRTIDLQGEVSRVANAQFATHFRNAYAQAMATARG